MRGDEISFVVLVPQKKKPLSHGSTAELSWRTGFRTLPSSLYTDLQSRNEGEENFYLFSSRSERSLASLLLEPPLLSERPADWLPLLFIVSSLVRGNSSHLVVSLNGIIAVMCVSHTRRHFDQPSCSRSGSSLSPTAKFLTDIWGQQGSLVSSHTRPA